MSTQRSDLADEPSSADLVLRVRALTKHFAGLRAVDGVDLELRRGETLGLVGESGCGKSTLARTILAAHRPTSGDVWLNSGSVESPVWHCISALSQRALRPLRRKLQMVFQDPHASLNPRQTIGAIVAEPMEIHRIGTRREIRKRAAGLLDEVGLDPRHLKRFPHEFSGGQRQRVGIARALALDPTVIVCDEPVSALDVSVRSQVLNLLLELQERRGLSFLFVAHDLSVVKRISHRVAVMYRGRIVEVAPAADLYRAPRHPYTRTLLAAIPVPDPEVERERRTARRALESTGVRSDASQHGCAFAPRCPEAFDTCVGRVPQLTPEAGAHRAACWLEAEIPVEP